MLLGVSLSGSRACGQDTPEVKLRGDRFDRVRSLIEESLRTHQLASVAIAAAQDGEIVWEEAFGWADRERQIQAVPSSIYALASISKSFTATGLMVLVERGLVDLDHPVNDYLGDAKLVSRVDDPAEATVRQVLWHTAGLPAHHNIFFEGEPARPPEQDESIRRYGIVVDPPGREFVYSNFGYGVLDRVISHVSGISYPEFMRREVFEPLGLSHTSVHIVPALREHAVRHYDEAGNVVPPLDFDHVGASAVHSSVHDLIRYGMFHLRNELPGQRSILSDRTIERMQEPSDVTMPDEILEVHPGLGWAIIDVDGIRMVSATGGMPGTVTRLALVPEENAAVAVLVNGGGWDYSPWEIEWETFAAMIAGFPDRPEIAAEGGPVGGLPAELRGEWKGRVSTYLGDLPASLSIAEARELKLEIDGRKAAPIPVRSPLGSVRFKGGVFEAPFVGSISTDDARRSPHVLFLRLRPRGDTMNGVVAAVAMNRTFWLPYWMELRRVTEAAPRR